MQVEQDDRSAAPSATNQPEQTAWSGAQTNAWSGAHIQMTHNHHQDLTKVIMLDNGSSTSLFANPEMVQDIKDAETPLNLMTK